MDVLQLRVLFPQFSFELVLQTLLIFLHLPSLVIITPLDLSYVAPNVRNILVQLLQFPLHFALVTLTLVHFASGFLDLLPDRSNPFAGHAFREFLLLLVELVLKLPFHFFFLGLKQVILLLGLVFAFAFEVGVGVEKLVGQFVHFAVVLRLQFLLQVVF